MTLFPSSPLSFSLLHTHFGPKILQTFSVETGPAPGNQAASTEPLNGGLLTTTLLNQTQFLRRMHRALLIGALLLTVGFLATAQPAAAANMCGTELPGGLHVEHPCVQDVCLEDDTCVNAADPVGSFKTIQEWLRDQLP